MQTKSVEPGAHSGIARYFGLMFLFQALASLFAVLSEQFFGGFVSFYFAVFAVIMTALAVCLCVPAAVAVAIPEPNQTAIQAVVFVAAVIGIVCTALFVGPSLAAAPDVPYIDSTLRRELLAAITGGMALLGVAAVVRIIRKMKGRNGAVILLTGLTIAVVSGIFWSWLEPRCKQIAADDAWGQECPLSRTFDHNFFLTIFMIAANVLAAEGVLRLMAAGSGVEGYVEIIPVIQT